jgi:hypothetical protein
MHSASGLSCRIDAMNAANKQFRSMVGQSSCAQLKVHPMHDDDELPAEDNKRKRKPKDVSALPVQLGQKLRTLFADVESEPVPAHLVELLDALAAKEKKPE